MTRPAPRARALPAALAVLLVAAPAASAHVDVLPTRVTQGEAQQFTIRVPTERDVPTTAVTVEFPPQITVYAFARPAGGWDVTPLRADDGTFSGVRYTGGEIPANGYADFTVLGTPFEAGEAVFPSRQRYGDGQVKPWTAAPEAPGEVTPETGPTEPGPAAAVQVVAEGTAAGDGEAVAPAPPPASADDDGSGAAVWLGVIAIGISALAMLGVGLLWSTRPARLPDD